MVLITTVRKQLVGFTYKKCDTSQNEGYFYYLLVEDKLLNLSSHEVQIPSFVA